MFQLEQKTEEKVIQELKWRFNISEIEIRDLLDKTISYVNSIQTTLQIEDPKQLEALIMKLIKIA